MYGSAFSLFRIRNFPFELSSYSVHKWILEGALMKNVSLFTVKGIFHRKLIWLDSRTVLGCLVDLIKELRIRLYFVVFVSISGMLLSANAVQIAAFDATPKGYGAEGSYSVECYVDGYIGYSWSVSIKGNNDAPFGNSGINMVFFVFRDDKGSIIGVPPLLT
jgi:hypothetical protein